MTARSKRTDEIRARLEAALAAYDTDSIHEDPIVDFEDLRYLLARVAKLEGLLRAVHNAGTWPEFFDRIEAALGDES